MKKQSQKSPQPNDDLEQFDLDIHSFLEDRNYVGDMGTDERKAFLAAASSIFQTPAFIVVVNELMNIQACHSILQAPTSPLIMFDRAGINVLKLLKDEFKRLDKAYKDSVKPDEEFDEDEVI